MRLYAAQILWYLNPEKDTAELIVPVLGKILKKDQAFRADAAITLVNIGSRATAAVDDLIDALKDPSNDPDQRGRCAFALASIGPDAAPAVKVLADLVKNGGGSLSEHAAFALQRIGPKAVGALPELAAVLKDRNVQLRGLRGARAGRHRRRGQAGRAGPGRGPGGERRPEHSHPACPSAMGREPPP